MSEHSKKTSKKPLREKVAELEQELSEKQEKILRLLADFDNYRKRMEKELEERVQREKEAMLLQFLDVYETLQQVAQELEHTGLRMTLNQFKKMLADEGIEEIEAVGKPFDYSLHHAVATKQGEKDGTVVEEVKKGYMLNGRVLRPSYVIVAKGDENGKSDRN